MTFGALASLLLVAQPPLPSLRPAASPPAVPATGVEAGSGGTTVDIAATAGFALSDLYVADMNTNTVFSLSAPTFPADSLVAGRAARARAWLDRVPASGRGVLMDPVLGAELEAAAGDDARAERTFAAALAAAAPGRRSYVLARAVATFVDGERDDSALARRLTMAERHLADLMALPQGGYAVVYDSLMLVDRAYASATAVLAASARLGDAARVTAHTTHALATLRRYTGYERVSAFREIPYEMVVTVMLGQPRARATLDSLATRVLRIVAVTPAELLTFEPHDRPLVPKNIRDEALQRIAKAAPLGRPAPPILSHAWINAPDSLYQPAPRSHAFDDGTIRLLYFTQDWWQNGGYRSFPLLTRLHDAIVPWGQVVMVSHTNGAMGTDLVEAPEEVAWLRELYRGQARLTPVIAQWAAPKEPAPYDGRLPVPPPLDSAYVEPTYPVFIVDGHGIVRGFSRADSRRDENRLRRALTYLHDEATGTSGATPRPAILVPADARAH